MATRIDRTVPRIAVIGCGYWGKNHVRVFRQLGALVGVCEPTETGQRTAREIAPGVQIHLSTEALFAAGGIDGVVIATPAESHFAVTQAAMLAGYDVLVEKPLALRLEHGQLLQDLARERNRILMVGHVLEYHPAIVRLGQLIDAGEIGSVRYVYSNRLNLGKIRREENILWSFAPHDIAIILRFIGRLPYEVIATGGAYVQPNIPDVTVTQLLFDNGVRGHVFVSWLHPYKEQRLVVVGSKKMAAFDDVSKELRLYDQRVEWQNGEPRPVKAGSCVVPYSSDEPLQLECEAFLNAIQSRVAPVSDAQSAVDVLEVLTAAQRSLMTQGQAVFLQMPRFVDRLRASVEQVTSGVPK